MSSTRLRTTRIVLAALGCLASVASGQEGTPLVSKLDPAWDRLAQSNATFLTEEQQQLLNDLAFAAAASEVCKGFTVDRDAFKKGFDAFRSDRYMELPLEKRREFEYRLLVNFGATAALYTAEGLLYPKQGCASAEKKRSQGPGRFWVAPAPDR